MSKFGIWRGSHNRDDLDKQYVADEFARRAQLLMQRGDYKGAQDFYKQAVDTRRSAIPGTEFDALDGLGRAMFRTGQYDQAIGCFQEAIALIERNFYKDHPKMAPMLDHWAEACIAANKLPEAEQLIQHSLRLKQNSVLQNDVEVLETIRTLAEVQRRLGNYADAEKLLNKTMPILESATIAPLEEFLYELAQLHLAQGQIAAAEAELRRALPIFANRAGKNRRFATALQTFAEVLAKRGEEGRAEMLQQEASNIMSTPEGPEELPENTPGVLYFESGLYPATILH